MHSLTRFIPVHNSWTAATWANVAPPHKLNLQILPPKFCNNFHTSRANYIKYKVHLTYVSRSYVTWQSIYVQNNSNNKCTVRKNKEVASDEVFRTKRATVPGKTPTFKRTLSLSRLVGGHTEGLRNTEFLIHYSQPLFYEDVCRNLSKILNYSFKLTGLVLRKDFVSFSSSKTHDLCSRYPFMHNTSNFVVILCPFSKPFLQLHIHTPGGSGCQRQTVKKP